MKFRLEKDTLGKVNVPVDVYYGAQTARAIENFPVSGIKPEPIFIKATAMVKSAAALANMDCGAIDEKTGNAVVAAAGEVMEGAFDEQFVVDVYQAGAGTSHNMNANEVIANRAIEILGGKKGDYKIVHPNDHVNMSQSTNDSFPTSMRLAALMKGDDLIKAVSLLHRSLKNKSLEFDNIIKSGRTHLQDAVPVRLGQEFGGYAGAVEKGCNGISNALNAIKVLGIGATAAGTGLNTPARYRKSIVNHLAAFSGYQVEESENLFESTQSMADFANLSSALKNLSLELTRIANDLRLMSSGPTTGLAEINLPPVQPGSSIMPGKVNPVMAESLNMVAFQVMGYDHTVSMACQAGQLELNVMMPVINYNILQSMEILKNGITLFANRCVDGIKADKERCREYSEKTVGLATVLNLHIGYSQAAEISKEAARRERSVREIVVERGIMNEKNVDKVFNIKNLT